MERLGACVEILWENVDFSARSVITADPTLSIRQLGVPMKIAKNITKPVVVNEKYKIPYEIGYEWS